MLFLRLAKFSKLSKRIRLRTLLNIYQAIFDTDIHHKNSLFFTAVMYIEYAENKYTTQVLNCSSQKWQAVVLIDLNSIRSKNIDSKSGLHVKSQWLFNIGTLYH